MNLTSSLSSKLETSITSKTILSNTDTQNLHLLSSFVFFFLFLMKKSSADRFRGITEQMVGFSFASCSSM